MVFIDFACQLISGLHVLSECDFYSFLIMFPVKLVCVPQEVVARVVTSVILIIILSILVVKNSLHVGNKFLTIYERASVCLDIILLIMTSAVFGFFVKFIICDQMYIICAVGILALLIH